MPVSWCSLRSRNVLENFIAIYASRNCDIDVCLKILLVGVSVRQNQCRISR